MLLGNAKMEERVSQGSKSDKSGQHIKLVRGRAGRRQSMRDSAT